jgi:hypothetical protein
MGKRQRSSRFRDANCNRPQSFDGCFRVIVDRPLGGSAASAVSG